MHTPNPTLPPPIALGDKQTKPWGFPMTQNRFANMVWSYAFETHQPSTIIELGSYNAGFTTVLGVHAWNLKVPLHTFDTCIAPDDRWKDLSHFLGIKFHNLDVFANIDFIAKLIQQAGTTYLLCDDGDHPKEFNAFAEFMKVGDIIAAHDYYCPGYWEYDQVPLEKIQESIDKHQLRPFLQSHFDLTGWCAFMKEPL